LDKSEYLNYVKEELAKKQHEVSTLILAFTILSPISVLASCLIIYFCLPICNEFPSAIITIAIPICIIWLSNILLILALKDAWREYKKAKTHFESYKEKGEIMKLPSDKNIAETQVRVWPDGSRVSVTYNPYTKTIHMEITIKEGDNENEV